MIFASAILGQIKSPRTLKKKVVINTITYNIYHVNITPLGVVWRTRGTESWRIYSCGQSTCCVPSIHSPPSPSNKNPVLLGATMCCAQPKSNNWSTAMSTFLLPVFQDSLGSMRRRRRHPTPVLLPGESHGQRSLVGRSPWGC